MKKGSWEYAGNSRMFPQIRTLYKVRKRNCKMMIDRQLVDWRDWVKVISRTREGDGVADVHLWHSQ